jgi:hypothetical protein
MIDGKSLLRYSEMRRRIVKEGVMRIPWRNIFLIPLSASVIQAQVFVSPMGDDTSSGSIDAPLKTITKAIAIVSLGDTIYVRGGRYSLSSTINIDTSGSSDSLFCLFAYHNERPVLDYTGMAIDDVNRGINVRGSYWHIKGIDIQRAGDNGMNVSGSNNIIEFCSFSENGDTGLQLGGGASNNQIINCDSYYNVDPKQGNADGFAPKMDVGSGNYFYGCRSWQNSDDGWDGYLRGADDVSTTLENCWTFENGYLKGGGASLGNGNGFKMGGSDDKTLMHNIILKRCIAFDNRSKGFDQNSNKGSMTLYNCSGYNNGTNYRATVTLNNGKTLTIANCVALGSYGSLGSFAVQQTNSWLGSYEVSSADFVSVDTSGVRGPRKADGSLPEIAFMHLAPDSKLIDAGTAVGLPYVGIAPDLGAFESDRVTSVNERVLASSNSFLLSQNYPNPFNPVTHLRFSVPEARWPTADIFDSRFVTLKIYDMLGREVAVLVNENRAAGSYEVRFDGTNLPSGVYIYKLHAGNVVETKRMTLMK